MVVMDVMDPQDHEVSLEGMGGMDRLDNWDLEGILALLGGSQDHRERKEKWEFKVYLDLLVHPGLIVVV